MGGGGCFIIINTLSLRRDEQPSSHSSSSSADRTQYLISLQPPANLRDLVLFLIFYERFTEVWLQVYINEQVLTGVCFYSNVHVDVLPRRNVFGTEGFSLT